jgi:hypothetical protein
MGLNFKKYLRENGEVAVVQKDELDQKFEDIHEENPELVEEVCRAIKEAALLLEADCDNEDDMEEHKESDEVQDAISEGVLLERNIVRFDKKTRLIQLTKVAVLKLAKDSNDPLYEKFVMYKKKERYIEEKFQTKYGAKAQVLARKMLRDLIAKKHAKGKKLSNNDDDK